MSETEHNKGVKLWDATLHHLGGHEAADFDPFRAVASLAKAVDCSEAEAWFWIKEIATAEPGQKFTAIVKTYAKAWLQHQQYGPRQ